MSLAIATTACSGEEPDQAVPPNAIPIDVATTRQLEEAGREFQRSLAADGYLDRVEYERLVYGYQQCAIEGGASLGQGAMWTAFGTFHFEFRVPGGSRAAVDGCTAAFWEPLGPLWSLHHSPSQEQIRAANDALGECLRQAGEDFPYEHPTLEDFHRFHGGNLGRPSILNCARKVGAEHGIPNFAGG